MKLGHLFLEILRKKKQNFGNQNYKTFFQNIHIRWYTPTKNVQFIEWIANPGRHKQVARITGGKQIGCHCPTTQQWNTVACRSTENVLRMCVEHDCEKRIALYFIDIGKRAEPKQNCKTPSHWWVHHHGHGFHRRNPTDHPWFFQCQWSSWRGHHRSMAIGSGFRLWSKPNKSFASLQRTSKICLDYGRRWLDRRHTTVAREIRIGLLRHGVWYGFVFFLWTNGIDSFLLFCSGTSFTYTRKQVFRLACDWRYAMFLHEYPETDRKHLKEGNLSGNYNINSRRLGARNKTIRKYGCCVYF